jgi:hypothetical protein
MLVENEEHGKDGQRYHEDASYQGWVVVCLCGDRFMDEEDLEKHIEECTHGKVPRLRIG